MDVASSSLLGAIVGSIVTLIASVVVPWVRDELDRRRRQLEQDRLELRTALLAAQAALLGYRQHQGRGTDQAGASLATYGAALNELTVRLTPEQQPVLDVLWLMVAMVQEPNARIANMLGEAMMVLNLWLRGDVTTDQIIPEVERRSGVKFSEDRKSVVPV